VNLSASTSPRLAANAAIVVGLAAMAVSARPATACPVGRTTWFDIGAWWEAEDGHRSPSPPARDAKPDARKPTIETKLGAITIVGDLEPLVIRRYLRRSLDQISTCHYGAQLRKPGAHGALTARFLISPLGATTNVTVTGFDDATARCVADVIDAIELVPTDGNAAMVTVALVMPEQ
jgi:hypothetical protein